MPDDQAAAAPAAPAASKKAAKNPQADRSAVWIANAAGLRAFVERSDLDQWIERGFALISDDDAEAADEAAENDKDTANRAEADRRALKADLSIEERINRAVADAVSAALARK